MISILKCKDLCTCPSYLKFLADDLSHIIIIILTLYTYVSFSLFFVSVAKGIRIIGEWLAFYFTLFFCFFSWGEGIRKGVMHAKQNQDLGIASKDEKAAFFVLTCKPHLFLGSRWRSPKPFREAFGMLLQASSLFVCLFVALSNMYTHI